MRRRLVAGLWFAVAAFLLRLVFFFVYFSRYHQRSELFFPFVVAPAIIFALCGATIGAPILRLKRGSPGSSVLATVWSAGVSAAAVGIFILSWAAVDEVNRNNPRLLSFVFDVFYITLIWGPIHGVVLWLTGMFAGWLVYHVKLRWID
jgi:hypothetical protein